MKVDIVVFYRNKSNIGKPSNNGFFLNVCCRKNSLLCQIITYTKNLNLLKF